MRSFVISTFALAVVMAPAVAFAQQTPPPGGQQPPAGQQPAAAQPASPAGPKLSFKAPVGVLFVQVKQGPVVGADGKPDPSGQTYQQVFEEMMGKLKSGLAASSDPALKSQASSWHYYKAAEPGQGGTVVYVVMIDPLQPGTEYQFLELSRRR